MARYHIDRKGKSGFLRGLIMCKVTIVTPTYNNEIDIRMCINSILKQTHEDFELIIVDDCSTDGTSEIIKSFQDRRIKYIKNEKNRGSAESRNVGIRASDGEFIFFIDADCVAQKNWLECGMSYFLENQGNDVLMVGVEGRTFYSTAQITISDRVIEVGSKGAYNTCNMAYKRRYLESSGGFNHKYDLAHEDRDMAFRILKYGEIGFCEDMIVVHRRKKRTKKRLFSDARRARNLVHFIKEHGDYKNRNLLWKILYPRKLLIILFPFLLIVNYSIRSLEDLQVAFWMYVSAWHMRIVIWKAAIAERIFIV
jgi:glycosyltransferase involved in cell wall biosynthesis